MIIGLESLGKKFQELARQKKLNSAYLFFGEPQVGKFTFAMALANYLETGDFAPAHRVLIDALIFSESSGIELARQTKIFLSQKPFLSAYRTVIFNQADDLTPEAQNALLKVTEEPPATSILILVASDADALLPTLRSRLVKIYFPRLSAKKLRKYFPPDVVSRSFGRPGRAVQLTQAKDVPEPQTDEAYIDKLMENYYLSLRHDLRKNSYKLSQLLNRHLLLKRYNLNQKLQLKAIQNIINS